MKKPFDKLRVSGYGLGSMSFGIKPDMLLTVFAANAVEVKRHRLNDDARTDAVASLASARAKLR
jgi:hypothetical protein